MYTDAHIEMLEKKLHALTLLVAETLDLIYKLHPQLDGEEISQLKETIKNLTVS